MKLTRLSHQILAVFVTVIILSLGASGWAVTALAQRIVTNNVAQGNQELARRIAEEIDLVMQDVHPILVLLTESAAVQSMNQAFIGMELADYQERFPALTTVYVADLTGQQLARTDGTPLENIATTYGFQVAREGHELISDVYWSQENQAPTLTIYLPISSRNNMIGVLAADVNFARIQRVLESLTLSHDETVVVFAANGQAVAHSHITELAEPPVLSDLALINTLVRGPIGVEEGYTDELGRTVIGVHAPANALGWGVVIQIPESALASEVAALQRTMGMGLLGSLTLAVAAGWLMARQLTLPVTKLAQATKQVASGDLTAVVKVTAVNEIGQLAGAFNQMVANIQQTQMALQESDLRYRGLFEDSPIALWEEDFSAVKQYIDNQRDSGITDFKSYFKNNPEAIRHCAAMVKVVDVNRAALEMLQYESKEEMLVNLARIFREESYPVFQEELFALITGQTVFETETVNQTRRHDEIFVSMKLTVVPGYEHTWSKVFIAMTEITKRVQAEKALQQYAERLKTLRHIDQAILAAQSPEAIAQAALGHIRQLVHCSQVNLATFDLASDEATVLAIHANGETRLRKGMRFPIETFGVKKELQQGHIHMVEDIMHITHPSAAVQTLQAEGIRSYLIVPLTAYGELIGSLNLSSEEPKAFTLDHTNMAREVADQLAIAIQQARLYEQIQHHTADLEVRVAAATKEIGRRADELTILYEIGRDLVATLDLKTLLPVITQRLTNILEADRCAIFLFDERAGVLQSQAAFGYMAKRLDNFSYKPGEEIVGQAFAKGKTQYVPDLSLMSDLPRRDEIRTVLAVPLASLTAGVLGVLSAASLKPEAFASEQQQLLETMAGQIAVAVENARLYEAAQEADRLKSAFLASMSHELRTPLNSIIGFTGIILQGLAGPLSAEQTKQLGMIRDSARHLLALINDVLDVSKIESGQLEVASEPMNMRQAVEKVVRTVMPLAERKGLALTADIAPEVGEIVSDQRRVEQILINLVNNAIKFTEQGDVRIVCQVKNGFVTTQITDTGMGIKSENMDKLFKPFRQIDTGVARVKEGTGLGLSICKKLVEMLGGTIWVESEWSKGSVFTFTLPLT